MSGSCALLAAAITATIATTTVFLFLAVMLPSRTSPISQFLPTVDLREDDGLRNFSVLFLAFLIFIRSTCFPEPLPPVEEMPPYSDDRDDDVDTVTRGVEKGEVEEEVEEEAVDVNDSLEPVPVEPVPVEPVRLAPVPSVPVPSVPMPRICEVFKYDEECDDDEVDDSDDEVDDEKDDDEQEAGGAHDEDVDIELLVQQFAQLHVRDEHAQVPPATESKVDDDLERMVEQFAHLLILDEDIEMEDAPLDEDVVMRRAPPLGPEHMVVDPTWPVLLP
ncbi:hypothetical protein BJV82DRAFT_579694 [Fennellomyces sp. T-0311]|nr:hypothetical protein BJV82DRAFT_579694 [Fennellomyces sp. T-0311]